MTKLKNLTRLAALAAFAWPAFAPAQDNERETVIGPVYADAPEMTVNPDVPHGDVHEFVMKSEDSKIYPGIVRIEGPLADRRDAYGNRIAAPADMISKPAPYERHVWVYIPKQYVPGTAAPLIVVQDGATRWQRVEMALDNLIAAHRVPVMIMVAPSHGGSDAQGSERGLEYDTMSDRYYNWVESELLPRVQKDYNVKFTTNPEGRATIGYSSGGIAAFTMAWLHPESYHRVLTYSGTYVNQASPVDPRTRRGGWEYHDHIIAEAPKKPIRVWMEAGENDNGYDQPETTWHNWVLANNRFVAVLRAKGYTYRYVFAKQAKHTDARVIGQTLPEALEWLWAGYKP